MIKEYCKCECKCTCKCKYSTWPKIRPWSYKLTKKDFFNELTN